MNLKILAPNMTQLSLHADVQVLFSYETPVASRIAGEMFQANCKYSATTSKHVKKWLAGSTATKVEPEFFTNLLLPGGVLDRTSVPPYTEYGGTTDGNAKIIDMEVWIANVIEDADGLVVTEPDVEAELGQMILKEVLSVFRPDLFEASHVVN